MFHCISATIESEISTLECCMLEVISKLILLSSSFFFYFLLFFFSSSTFILLLLFLLLFLSFFLSFFLPFFLSFLLTFFLSSSSPSFSLSFFSFIPKMILHPSLAVVYSSISRVFKNFTISIGLIRQSYLEDENRRD